MPKPPFAEVLPANVLEHPAVYAWSQLGPDRLEPDGVEVLKRKPKSSVYRLTGVGPHGSSIIAKRGRAETAPVERMIYEEVLPRLPVPALDCHGFWEEPAGKFSWLFLEDAIGECYSPQDPQHRALAANWLAEIHAATGNVSSTLSAKLPDRRTRHYRATVRSCREDFRRPLAAPAALLPDNLSLLEALVADCDALDAHWDELEEICEPIPPALVHGDFVNKNVRFRATSAGLEFLVFDWEYAGWGVPAADFAQFTGHTVSPDMGAYSAVAEWAGGKPEVAVLQRLAVCGKFFRLLDEIHWISAFLDCRSQELVSGPLSCLKVYEGRLSEALRAVKWI